MDGSKLPAKKEAEDLLLWGHERNPGPWSDHSKVVARAAKSIALKCGLDGSTAYVLGLLHDIGRYEGVTGLRHIYAGYKVMNEKGFHHNAKICLTHSFPAKDLNPVILKNDCTKEEINEIENEMNKYEYDDYDRLIQLCDAICIAEGVCLMEMRLVDIVRRYKVYDQRILGKWDAFFELKEYFDSKCGINVYRLFYEEIIKNSIK